jgi:hypothetical protein
MWQLDSAGPNVAKAACHALRNVRHGLTGIKWKFQTVTADLINESRNAQPRV